MEREENLPIQTNRIEDGESYEKVLSSFALDSLPFPAQELAKRGITPEELKNRLSFLITRLGLPLEEVKKDPTFLYAPIQSGYEKYDLLRYWMERTDLEIGMYRNLFYQASLSDMIYYATFVRDNKIPPTSFPLLLFSVPYETFHLTLTQALLFGFSFSTVILDFPELFLTNNARKLSDKIMLFQQYGVPATFLAQKKGTYHYDLLTKSYPTLAERFEVAMEEGWFASYQKYPMMLQDPADWQLTLLEEIARQKIPLVDQESLYSFVYDKASLEKENPDLFATVQAKVEAMREEARQFGKKEGLDGLYRILDEEYEKPESYAWNESIGVTAMLPEAYREMLKTYQKEEVPSLLVMKEKNLSRSRVARNLAYLVQKDPDLDVNQAFLGATTYHCYGGRMVLEKLKESLQDKEKTR